MTQDQERRLSSFVQRMFNSGAFDEIVVMSLEEALDDVLEEIRRTPQENRTAAQQDELLHNIDVGMALVTCARYFSGKQYVDEAEILNAERADVFVSEWKDD